MTRAALLVAISALAAAAVVVLVYVVGAPIDVVVAVGFGAACLLWLLVLLAVPWNLYFQARAVLRDIRISGERGIDVPAERAQEARGIARRTAALAVGGHVLSAAAAATVAVVADLPVGYYAAAIYLLATLVRPAVAYLAQLREQLSAMRREVRYPREDAARLRSRVERLERSASSLESRVSELAQRQDRMARELEADSSEVMSGMRTLLRLLNDDPRGRSGGEP